MLFRMSPVVPDQVRQVTVERPAPPDRADLLPPQVGRYTRRFVYGQDERHLSFEQGGGHHGSHPHLVHEFVRSIVERRPPRIDAVTAAHWTAAGICAHESAMNGGREVIVPEFAGTGSCTCPRGRQMPPYVPEEVRDADAKVRQEPIAGFAHRAGMHAHERGPTAAMASIRAALDQGINFFDHADVYGGGRREETFSAIWEEIPGLRSRIVVQSKCGIRRAGEGDARVPTRYDFSYEHIVESVQGSLRRLKTEYLDVLLLHRPDALVEPEEVARAFDELHRRGQVRWFGVSNHTAAQMQLLQRWVQQPLVANQLEFSVVHTHMLDEGIVMNREDFATPTRNEGTMEYCRLHDITIQAWGPLAAGALGKTATAPQSPPGGRSCGGERDGGGKRGQPGSGHDRLVAQAPRAHPAHHRDHESRQEEYSSA